MELYARNLYVNKNLINRTENLIIKLTTRIISCLYLLVKFLIDDYLGWNRLYTSLFGRKRFI